MTNDCAALGGPSHLCSDQDKRPGLATIRLSVFQRYHVLVALAEGRDALNSAFRLWQQPDWAEAKHGVAIFREVPAPTLAGGRCSSDTAIHRRLRRLNAVRTVERN